MKHGAAKKRTHAHGAKGNCTTCLQDPCGCVPQDIPASYGGVVYDEQPSAISHQQSAISNQKEDASSLKTDN